MQVLVKYKNDNYELQTKVIRDYYMLRKYVTSAVMQLKEGSEVVITKLKK